MTSNLTSAEIYMESCLPSGSSFGTRVDTGEQVFINARLTRKFGVEEGQLRKFTIVPNDPSRINSTPWRALGISLEDTGPVVEDTPRVEEAKLEDRIIKMFEAEANQFAHTAVMLAEELGATEADIQLALSRMHNAGEMAKAQVHSKGGQDRASFVLWARDTTWFAL